MGFVEKIAMESLQMDVHLPDQCTVKMGHVLNLPKNVLISDATWNPQFYALIIHAQIHLKIAQKMSTPL
jgi:hypothetical protein